MGCGHFWLFVFCASSCCAPEVPIQMASFSPIWIYPSAFVKRVGRPHAIYDVMRRRGPLDKFPQYPVAAIVFFTGLRGETHNLNIRGSRVANYQWLVS